ncbi:proteoglycan 4-like [Eriocheir sinensis]|uniref:proteoglycan 4-like n=1 Tax=Eriocheir sinensis TaxID=95602 RepID=UPI0021C75B57|nr:proteoglycan 4-like [Eriocheir sinensis]
MTVAAAEAVVRWAVMVAALACVCAAQDLGVVDISRCKNSCSAVPEDLWPSCCEAHTTCCEEFADSCMHDCLPRVHTGDVSAVEERPGMCCALYNLCCFRETFRISSSKSHSQEPVNFPIVHRFHVPPPTLQEAINPAPRPAQRPAPRPAFSAPKQTTDNLDQDSITAPKRPSFNRPQLSKKTFRPERPQSLKKPQGPEEEEEPSTGVSGPNQPDGDDDKPKTRPKFGFLANRKAQEERRKLESQEEPGSQVKVTRRPATADIRQEVATHEVMVAESQGSRRLDASINPMVTRKRIKQPGETRQESSSVQVRKTDDTPAREGRTLGAGRSIIRPAVQQTSGRGQSVAVAGQEDPRPPTRRPSQTPPPPVIEATPRVPVKEILGATVAAAKIPEPVKESESTLIKQEASSQVETIISAVEQAQETDAALAPTGEKSSVPKEDEASEPSQQEEATEKKMEPSAGEMEEGTKPEVMKDEKSGPETPEKAAFAPPEIEVNIPKEPKVASAPEVGAATLEEPARIRGGNSRTRSSAGEQPSATEAAQTQGGSSSRGGSRGRGTSRTASVPEAEDTEAPTSTSRRSRTRG